MWTYPVLVGAERVGRLVERRAATRATLGEEGSCRSVSMCACVCVTGSSPRHDAGDDRGLARQEQTVQCNVLWSWQPAEVWKVAAYSSKAATRAAEKAARVMERRMVAVFVFEMLCEGLEC